MTSPGSHMPVWKRWVVGVAVVVWVVGVISIAVSR